MRQCSGLNMTKIVIISDIHGNQPALEAVCEDYCMEMVDDVWFLGDLFDPGPYPVQVYSILTHTAKRSVWLAGNHDLAMSAFLDSVPNLTGGTKLEDLKRCLHDMHPVYQQAQEIARKSIQDNFIIKASANLTHQYLLNGLGIHVAHGLPHPDRFEAATGYISERAPQKAGLPNENSLLSLRMKLNQPGQVWILGHTHFQTAWAYVSNQAKWVELIQDFGQRLNGEMTKTGPPKSQRNQKHFYKTFEFDFAKAGEDSLVILNPGSVGLPRDGSYFPEYGYLAKYMVLTVEGTCVRGEFRAVLYPGNRVIDAWKSGGYPERLAAMLTG